jgi:hypothetical protein
MRHEDLSKSMNDDVEAGVAEEPAPQVFHTSEYWSCIENQFPQWMKKSAFNVLELILPVSSPEQRTQNSFWSVSKADSIHPLHFPFISTLWRSSIIENRIRDPGRLIHPIQITSPAAVSYTWNATTVLAMMPVILEYIMLASQYFARWRESSFANDMVEALAIWGTHCVPNQALLRAYHHCKLFQPDSKTLQLPPSLYAESVSLISTSYLATVMSILNSNSPFSAPLLNQLSHFAQLCPAILTSLRALGFSRTVLVGAGTVFFS